MSLTPRFSSNFQDEAFQFIKGAEAFVAGVYGDSFGVPTIGYGYALAIKNSQGVWSLKSTLSSDLGGLGIVLTPAQTNTLNSIVSALNAGNTQLAGSLSNGLGDQIGAGDIRQITQPEALTLFNLELNRAVQAVHDRFKLFLGSRLPGDGGLPDGAY